MFLTPTANYSRESLRDFIYFPQGPNHFSTLQTFVDFCLIHAEEKKLYSKQFFASFLDENIQYSLENIDPNFEVGLIVNKDKYMGVVTFSFNLCKLFDDSERQHFKTPTHYQKEQRPPLETMEFKFTLNIHPDQHYTMKILVQVLIRQLIKSIRHPSDNSVYYHRSFTSSIAKYPNAKVMHDQQTLHKEQTNMIIHRFLQRFIGCVTSNLKLNKISEKTETKQLMIYTNMIKPTFVSGFKSKLLHIEFLKNRTNENGYIHSNYPQPMFFGVEHKVLQSIHFEILDEYGERAKFIPSYHSNHLTLMFRRKKYQPMNATFEKW